jgi:hypothetical protein
MNSFVNSSGIGMKLIGLSIQEMGGNFEFVNVDNTLLFGVTFNSRD